MGDSIWPGPISLQDSSTSHELGNPHCPGFGSLPSAEHEVGLTRVLGEISFRGTLHFQKSGFEAKQILRVRPHRGCILFIEKESGDATKFDPGSLFQRRSNCTQFQIYSGHIESGSLLQQSGLLLKWNLLVGLLKSLWPVTRT